MASEQETPTSGQDFASLFQAGVSSYRAAKYNEAQKSFSEALKLNPESVQVLTNLGLTHYQLGKKGEAIALLRKAHFLDPSLSTPKSSLNFILPQLDVKEIPHEILFWESLREDLLVPVTLNSYLIVTALCFFAFGWLLLDFLGKRRRALKEEINPPPFPLILLIISLIFVSMISLTAMKIFDLQIPRGTIIADKVTVFSAPAQDSVALYDLYPGLEVILNQSTEKWIQVTYPGASSGWIEKSQIFQTSH